MDKPDYSLDSVELKEEGGKPSVSRIGRTRWSKEDGKGMTRRKR